MNLHHRALLFSSLHSFYSSLVWSGRLHPQNPLLFPTLLLSFSPLLLSSSFPLHPLPFLSSPFPPSPPPPLPSSSFLLYLSHPTFLSSLLPSFFISDSLPHSPLSPNTPPLTQHSPLSPNTPPTPLPPSSPPPPSSLSFQQQTQQHTSTKKT